MQSCMNSSNLCLLDAKPGDKIRIISFGNREITNQKLQQYGLFIGDIAQVVRIAPFEGPVLLDVNGREIALGESIASEVLIEKVL